MRSEPGRGGIDEEVGHPMDIECNAWQQNGIHAVSYVSTTPVAWLAGVKEPVSVFVGSSRVSRMRFEVISDPKSVDRADAGAGGDVAATGTAYRCRYDYEGGHAHACICLRACACVYRSVAFFRIV